MGGLRGRKMMWCYHKSTSNQRCIRFQVVHTPVQRVLLLMKRHHVGYSEIMVESISKHSLVWRLRVARRTKNIRNHRVIICSAARIDKRHFIGITHS